MKKCLTSILVMMLIPCLFVGCKKNKKDYGLDFDVYFPTIEYVTFDSKTGTMQTSTALGDVMEDRNYSSFIFVGNPEWIYNFTIQKVIFRIKTNMKCNMDFLMEVVNVEEGSNVEEVSGTNRFRKTLTTKVDKYKTNSIEVEVGTTFAARSGSIRLSLDSGTIDLNEGLEWKIVGVELFGIHE